MSLHLTSFQLIWMAGMRPSLPWWSVFAKFNGRHWIDGFTILAFLWAAWPTAFWLVAATMNWVASQSMTQLAVTATNHSAFSSDKMRSFEMRSDKVRWDLLYESWFTQHDSVQVFMWCPVKMDSCQNDPHFIKSNGPYAMQILLSLQDPTYNIVHLNFMCIA